MIADLAYDVVEDHALSARPRAGGSSSSVLVDFDPRLRASRVRSAIPSERQLRYRALAAKIRAWQREPVDFDPRAWAELREELKSSTISFPIPE